jgi:predicted DsbA family dithiol-disulfide isomerase
MRKTIEIVFDFSCPYCYITWHYLKRLQQQEDFSAEWLTWNIHPEVGPEGKQITEVVTNLDMDARRERLNGLGASVGVAPADQTFVPDTRLALQGMEFARERSAADKWADAVFAASFVEKKNIGDKTVLLEIAARVGLPANELDECLISGKYAPILFANDERFMKIPVEWVPTIFYQNRKVLEGAFTYEEAERVIKALGRE